MLWGLNTGRIKLDPGWDVVGFHEGDNQIENSDGTVGFNMVHSQNRFARNLFSDWRLQSNETRQARAQNTTNPFAPKTGKTNDGQFDSGVNFGHNIVGNAGQYMQSFNQTTATL